MDGRVSGARSSFERRGFHYRPGMSYLLRHGDGATDINVSHGMKDVYVYSTP